MGGGGGGHLGFVKKKVEEGVNRPRHPKEEKKTEVVRGKAN